MWPEFHRAESCSRYFGNPILILMHHLLFLFGTVIEASSLLQTHGFHLCVSAVRVTYP